MRATGGGRILVPCPRSASTASRLLRGARRRGADCVHPRHGQLGGGLGRRGPGARDARAHDRPDRRGFARSERPEPFVTNVHQHADDAAALIDALGAAPALVIGRSYGRQRRARPRRSAVGSSPRARAARGRPGDAERVGDAVAVGARARALRGSRGRHGHRCRDVHPRGRRRGGMGRIVGGGAARSSPTTASAIIAEVRGGFLDVSAEQLQAIAQPTLLVGGKDSLPAFIDVTNVMAQAMPQARVVWIDGGHHQPRASGRARSPARYSPEEWSNPPCDPASGSRPSGRSRLRRADRGTRHGCGFVAHLLIPETRLAAFEALRQVSS